MKKPRKQNPDQQPNGAEAQRDPQRLRRKVAPLVPCSCRSYSESRLVKLFK